MQADPKVRDEFIESCRRVRELAIVLIAPEYDQFVGCPEPSCDWNDRHRSLHGEQYCARHGYTLEKQSVELAVREQRYFDLAVEFLKTDMTVSDYNRIFKDLQPHTPANSGDYSEAS